MLTRLGEHWLCCRKVRNIVLFLHLDLVSYHGYQPLFNASLILRGLELENQSVPTYIHEPFYALAPSFTPPNCSWSLYVLADKEVPTLRFFGHDFIDWFEQRKELVYLFGPDVDLDTEDEFDAVVNVDSCIRFHVELGRLKKMDS